MRNERAVFDFVVSTSLAAESAQYVPNRGLSSQERMTRNTSGFVLRDYEPPIVRNERAVFDFVASNSLTPQNAQYVPNRGF